MVSINDSIDKDGIPDHKLSGFFCAVLLAPPPHSSQTLAPNAGCRLFSEGHDVGFATDDGVVLLPVDSKRDENRAEFIGKSEDSFKCELGKSNVIGNGTSVDVEVFFQRENAVGFRGELGFCSRKLGSCENSTLNSSIDVENSQCNGLERGISGFSGGKLSSCEDSMPNSLMDVENSKCSDLERGHLGFSDEKLGSCEGSMPNALMDVENSKCNGSKGENLGFSENRLGSCEDSIPPVDVESFMFNGLERENSGFLEGKLGSSMVECGTPSSSAQSKVSSKKKTRGIGLVHGSMSAVHQIHALVVDKCLKIAARVVGVGMNDVGERRVVVLVDVYLPLAVWSGWQFPRLKSVAGALFGHLSCDWGKRAALIARGEHHKSFNWYDKSLWELSDCHVLECKLHHIISDYSKKRLFDLHEIFKSSPPVGKRWSPDFSKLKPANNFCGSGIWELSDDVIVNILSLLRPLDLVRVASTCHHLKYLAVSIMPCMKLKLFPHQQTAVKWMIQRERNAEVLPHPLFMEFSTEDGFVFSVNSVTGEVINGAAPVIKDFRGGMFCDEPGLGKTITALSLILKTQGTLADPPEWAQVIWCTHKGEKRCGYYESGGNCSAVGEVSLGRNIVVQTPPKAQSLGRSISSMDHSVRRPPKRARLDDSQIAKPHNHYLDRELESTAIQQYEPAKHVIRCARSLNRIKKNLLYTYEDEVYSFKGKGRGRNLRLYTPEKKLKGSQRIRQKASRAIAGSSQLNETWVQCDACHKWRKLQEMNAPDTTVAWFCSMNADPLYQNCSIPEEHWDSCQPITFLQGFCAEGSSGGEEQNVAFFINILKDHSALIDSHTTKALSWLAKLSSDKLLQMEITGLTSPCVVSVEDSSSFHKIFQAFGLLKRVEKGTSKWHYPKNIKNLTFDVAALRIALREPLNSVRLYMSRATLVVVPANLVDHWKTQIEKHVRPGQLRVYVLTDSRKISPHNLAWDYDVVITTFSRLSAEWSPRKRSVLKQVHWLRIMLDEGHTLGSSLTLTNKLQMAISLVASNRWILTGTPTPNTPNNQLPQLQTMFKFLHEEVYGQSHKLWEAGIQRPFEADLEEGRSRLVSLLQRCMISARKIDLRAIPPCIKKVTFLNFTKEHAKTYNELVATVRRNILMADWNDPSHVESLLNPKQWKFRGRTIRNVRLSCCVAGHIKVTDVGEDIQETMDILSQSGLDPSSEEYALIKYDLMHGGNCLRCNEWCRLPVITPCRHLLCLDCVALNRERCTSPGCGYSYEMQTPETRPDNPNPKWPVPEDLIELQPSYKQDDWDPDWQSTSSSKVAYLVERLKELRDSKNQVGHCLSEENGYICYKKQSSVSQMNCIGSSFKPDYHSGSEAEFVADKIIIFSQFLEHLHVIEQQLILAGIGYAGMYSPMHSNNKMKSLANFQHDDNCMALLMDGSAALGLDLSFVTHVFLMEPIWDKSMEEQVISRAHRMGATRPIYVETLAMCGTIEQQMVEFLRVAPMLSQDADSCRRLMKEFGKLDGNGTQARRSLHDFAGSNYLSQLKCIRTNSSM